MVITDIFLRGNPKVQNLFSRFVYVEVSSRDTAYTQ